MPHLPSAPPKQKDFYRLERYSAGKWLPTEEGPSLVGIQVKAPTNCRYRILRVWHDKAQRRHFEVIRDSGDDGDLVPAGGPVRFFDPESRLVREDDGNILRSGRR